MLQKRCQHRDERVVRPMLTKRLLLESEKDGVEQFEVFNPVINHVVKFESLSKTNIVSCPKLPRNEETNRCPRAVVAHAIEQAMFPDDGRDFLDHKDE